MTGPAMVIVGAGECGTRAAFTLREEGWDGPIILVGAEPSPPYERPPLSKTGEFRPLCDDQALRTAGITLIAGTAATALDTATRELELADGRRLTYHRLLLATGARARPLPLGAPAPGETAHGETAHGGAAHGGAAVGSTLGRTAHGGAAVGTAFGASAHDGAAVGSTLGRSAHGGAAGGSAFSGAAHDGAAVGSAFSGSAHGGAAGGTAFGASAHGGAAGGSALGGAAHDGAAGGSALGGAAHDGAAGGSAFSGSAHGGAAGGSAFGGAAHDGAAVGSTLGASAHDGAAGGTAFGASAHGGAAGGTAFGASAHDGAAGGSALGGAAHDGTAVGRLAPGGTGLGGPPSGGPAVHLLRTHADAVALRRRLVPGTRVAVIGGGFIGLELASSAAALGCAVTVIELGPRLMGRAVPPRVAAVMAQRHVAAGVDVRCGTAVTGLVVAAAAASVAGAAAASVSVGVGDTATVGVGVGVGVAGAGAVIILSAGGAVAADVIVAGVGAVPETSLAQAAGIATADGIVVDAGFATSAPGVYAAGDCCRYPHPLYDGQPLRLESWRVAREHGAAAARAMLGATEPYAGVPWFWSDQHDLTLQVAGLVSAAAAEVVRPRPDGTEIWFGLSAEGRLVAAAAAGPGNTVAKDIKLAELLIARRAVPDPALLADPAVSLKAILRSAEADGTTR